MKLRNTLILAGIISAFCCSAVCAENVKAAAEDYSCTVTDFQAGEARVMVCYPSPNAADESGFQTSCTAPILLVYPDGGITDNEAVSYAQTTGLSRIAAENGSSICFVQPLNGSAWEEADKDSYASILQSFSDSSQIDAANGVGFDVDFVTGIAGDTEVLLGTQQRVYVYADGTGADLVANSLLQPVSVMTPWGFPSDATIAGCTLEHVTDVSGVQPNDIPVVYVGDDEEIRASLEEKCGEVTMESSSDFAEQFGKEIGTKRREDGILLDMNDYAGNGIVEDPEIFTVQTEEGEKNIACLLYYGDDLDIENGNVPLMLAFHGHGNTALYLAESSDWAFIGKENGFMTVVVDDHEKCSASDIVSLLEKLEEEYSVDPGRVYATGFSIGSVKTFDLMEQYPEKFAAFAPMNGYFAQESEIPQGIIVPTFYVGAQNSPLTELPCQSEAILTRLQTVLRANETVETLDDISMDDQESWEDPFWGKPGDIVYQVEDTEEFVNSLLTVHLFAGEDGRYYTAFCDSSSQGHQMFARNCRAAWDFMSQFSRNEDGSVIISESAYDRPSQDGSVTDNSYNLQ